MHCNVVGVGTAWQIDWFSNYCGWKHVLVLLFTGLSRELDLPLLDSDICPGNISEDLNYTIISNAANISGLDNFDLHYYSKVWGQLGFFHVFEKKFHQGCIY